MLKGAYILIFFTFFASASFALEESSFDTCINALHRNGGLSLRESQELCLHKPTPQTLTCQNNLFQVGFKDPQISFGRCSQNPKAAQYYQGSFFNGYFQDMPNGDKKTICSVTVNSKEERDSFEKVLPNANYDFVELLPERSYDRFVSRGDYWLERSCQSQVRCDALVFSGHFADSFIGDAGFEVSMADLKKFKDKNGCQPFFENIKEVYLFGCNTVASKKPDHRSIQQYLQVLITDGVAPHTAQRIAGRRYTPYDHSVAEKMKSLFPQASFIAGFPSTGPTGQRIQPTLERYLNLIKENDTPESRAQAFQKTLGRIGMILSSSAKHDPTASLPMDNSVTLKAQEVQAFVKKYGTVLPVAAVDILTLANQQKTMEASVLNKLAQSLQKDWQRMDSYNQKSLLCPLLLADHDSWLPQNLDCLSETSWLSYY